MADTQEVVKDSKSQASTAEGNSQVQDNPPAEESSASSEASRGVPYERFKEVNDRYRALENEVKELKSRVPAKEQREIPDFVSSQVKALVSAGFEEDTAKHIVTTADALTNAKIDRLRAEQAEVEARRQVESFKAKNPDWLDYEKDMVKIYDGLGEAAKTALANDPASMQLLLDIAKGRKTGESVDKATQKGKEEAYRAKGIKSAVSEQSGKQTSASGAPKITRKLLAEMPLDEFRRREAEIMAAYAKGQIE